jgi:ABC-2 type transport system permease protein
MFAIYKKEMKIFFTTMEAYVAISVFFLINGLILWYIPSDFNIFDNNQASLLPFFSIAPWVLLFLIPAITMKMINSELTQRTHLILFTKAIKKWEIICAKFFAGLTIGIAAILPSLIFAYSIHQLSNPVGNIDQGELLGSYIGMVFLVSLYTSIGLFCSNISKNPMISFIMTVIIILTLYFGIDFMAFFYNIPLMEYLSIESHYESISRGIIDSRDLVYFISMTMCFLYFSIIAIERESI